MNKFLFILIIFISFAASSQIKTDSIFVSASEIADSFMHPKQIIAAPDTNQFIVIIAVHAKLSVDTISYTVPDGMSLKYDTRGITQAWGTFTGFLRATQNKTISPQEINAASNGLQTNLSAVKGKCVVLKNTFMPKYNSPNPPNLTAKIIVTYMIVTL